MLLAKAAPEGGLVGATAALGLTAEQINGMITSSCCHSPRMGEGSSHEYSEVGQGLASIARSKAVDSAIDSHTL